MYSDDLFKLLFLQAFTQKSSSCEDFFMSGFLLGLFTFLLIKILVKILRTLNTWIFQDNNKSLKFAKSIQQLKLTKLTQQNKQMEAKIAELQKEISEIKHLRYK